MGMSSDGILFFGFVVGDEGSPPEWLATDCDEDFDEDFDDFVTRKAGIPEGATYEDRAGAIRQCPAQLVTFGHYNYQRYALIIRGTEKNAYEYGAKEVGDLTVAAERIVAFKAWCKAAGVPHEELKWMLASRFG